MNISGNSSFEARLESPCHCPSFVAQIERGMLFGASKQGKTCDPGHPSVAVLISQLHVCVLRQYTQCRRGWG